MMRNTTTRSRRMAAIALVAIFSGATCTGALAFGGNLGFLKDAPVTRFNDEDRELFQTNLTEALETDAEGNVRRWDNPKTGSSGEIAILKRFTYENKLCRNIRFTNRTRGHPDATTQTVMCKESDGQWRVDPQSKPPAAADPQQPANKKSKPQAGSSEQTK